jgi:hypothetical protein
MATGTANAGLSGGCQCGAVRYTLLAAPTRPSICHCRMCQKASGGPFMALTGVALAEIQWTRGKPKTFRSSSHATRGFCENCGTPLTYQFDGFDRIAVTIGSLDDPNAAPPTDQWGVEARLKWTKDVLTSPEHTSDELMQRRGIDSMKNLQHPDADS